MSARATDDEVAAILADPDKRISGELRWADDEDACGQESKGHAPRLEATERACQRSPASPPGVSFAVTGRAPGRA